MTLQERLAYALDRRFGRDGAEDRVVVEDCELGHGGEDTLDATGKPRPKLRIVGAGAAQSVVRGRPARGCQPGSRFRSSLGLNCRRRPRAGSWGQKHPSGPGNSSQKLKLARPNVDSLKYPVNFVTGETRVTRREARRAKGRPPCRGLLLLALTLIAAILAVSAASASAAPGRQLGIRPAIPSGSSNLGALTGSTQINATVALTPRDPAALAAYAQAVSTPGSSVYHQYLSVAQFAQQFGATPSDIAAVRSSLASHGLTVGSVTANGLSIGIGGPASKIGEPFSTSFRRYRLRSGREVFANISPPTVASNLAARVQGVFGLNTLPQAQPQGLEQAHVTGGQDTPSLDASTTADTPCPSATSEGNADLAYTANQIASAYGLDNLYGQGDVGAGATVALYELEPFTSSDIKQYQKCYGTQAVITTTPVDGGPINPQIGEAALDIEDVIGLAPKAAINVYQGPNNSQGQF